MHQRQRLDMPSHNGEKHHHTRRLLTSFPNALLIHIVSWLNLTGTCALSAACSILRPVIDQHEHTWRTLLESSEFADAVEYAHLLPPNVAKTSRSILLHMQSRHHPKHPAQWIERKLPLDGFSLSNPPLCGTWHSDPSNLEFLPFDAWVNLRTFKRLQLCHWPTGQVWQLPERENKALVFCNHHWAVFRAGLLNDGTLLLQCWPLSRNDEAKSFDVLESSSLCALPYRKTALPYRKLCHPAIAPVYCIDGVPHGFAIRPTEEGKLTVDVLDLTTGRETRNCISLERCCDAWHLERANNLPIMMSGRFLLISDLGVVDDCKHDGHHVPAVHVYERRANGTFEHVKTWRNTWRRELWSSLATDHALMQRSADGVSHILRLSCTFRGPLTLTELATFRPEKERAARTFFQEIASVGHRGFVRKYQEPRDSGFGITIWPIVTTLHLGNDVQKKQRLPFSEPILWQTPLFLLGTERCRGFHLLEWQSYVEQPSIASIARYVASQGTRALRLLSRKLCGGKR